MERQTPHSAVVLVDPKGEVRRLSVIGAPGTGKGVAMPFLKRLLQETWGKECHVISAGDLCRYADPYVGKERADSYRERIKIGNYLSDEEMTALLVLRFRELKEENPFILDGFPRMVRQWEMLKKRLADELLGFANRALVDCVIELITPVEVTHVRIENRLVQNPDGTTIRRGDDDLAVFDKRVLKYKEMSGDVLLELQMEATAGHFTFGYMIVNTDCTIEEGHERLRVALAPNLR